MSKKDKEAPIVTPTVAATVVNEKTIEQVQTEQFVAEYNALCDKHGLVISAQLEYTPLGLVPKLTLLKKEHATS